MTKDIAFLQKDDIWAISITITGRCNCYCSYCHYYASHKRSEYEFDMPEILFKNYVHLIKAIQENYHKKIQVRFSGGEPLVVGDKLFEYCHYVFQETGLNPYILTNGKLLDENIIEKARKAHVSAFLVSVENPYDESDGVPGTSETLEKIKILDNETVRVLPAVVVVKNEYFDKLLNLCDLFYDKIGSLPVISELNFHTFESPTQLQLQALHENVKSIAKKYYGITPIRIFPYVSPELYANGDKNYLTELDIDNTIGINDTNVDKIIPKIASKLERSYYYYDCMDKKCDWYDDCRIIKWLWFFDGKKITFENSNRLKDYCRMKKAINSGLFDGIMEQNKCSEVLL